jgi:hypothetical protein
MESRVAGTRKRRQADADTASQPTAADGATVGEIKKPRAAQSSVRLPSSMAPHALLANVLPPPLAQAPALTESDMLAIYERVGRDPRQDSGLQRLIMHNLAVANGSARIVWSVTKAEFVHEWKSECNTLLQRRSTSASPTSFVLQCGYCGYSSQRHFEPRSLAEIVAVGKGGRTPKFSNDAIVESFDHHLRTTCSYAMRETIGRVPERAICQALDQDQGQGQVKHPVIDAEVFDMLVRFSPKRAILTGQQLQRWYCDDAKFMAIAQELLTSCQTRVDQYELMRLQRRQRVAVSASPATAPLPRCDLELHPLKSLILSSVTQQVLTTVLELVRSPACRLEHLGLANNRLGEDELQRPVIVETVAAILRAPFAPLHVDIEGNAFNNNDAAIFAEAVSESRRLESVAWAGNPIGGGAVFTQLAQALQAKRHLGRRFKSNPREISFLSLGSRPGRLGVLQPFAAEPEALCGLLGGGDTFELRHLELSYMAIGRRAWYALHDSVLLQSRSLQQLILRAVGLDDAMTASLAEWLSDGASVNVLDLRDNTIGCVGAVALAKALTEGAVSFCNLAGNRIGRGGRLALADAIRDRTANICREPHPLEQLELSASDADSDADEALLTAARSHGISFKLVLQKLEPLQNRWTPVSQLLASVWPTTTELQEGSGSCLSLDDYEPPAWASKRNDLQPEVRLRLTGRGR